MGLTWRDRQEQWLRFAAWETERLRSDPDDFSSTLVWAGEAWDLARRFDDGDDALAEERWLHLAQVHATVARLRPPA
jgi:hypothetical protein